MILRPFFRTSSRSSSLHATCFVIACCAWARVAGSEPFIGQFELKTLESAPGSMEFQSQNAWAWGQPERAWVEEPGSDILYDENSLFRARYALELEIGLSESLKVRVGVEAEDERIDDPASATQADEFEGLRLEEFGAELVVIFIAREADGFGLGAVVEVEGPLDQEEPNSLIVGPILEYQSDEWMLAAVPMLVLAFGGDSDEGEPRDEKWDFAYAAQIVRTISDRWSIALEGYGTVERLGSTGTPSPAATYFGDSDQHRLGPVVYYAHAASAGTEITLGVGLLEALNSATADHTLKLSIEVDF
jgi:hypothetical protein